MRGRTTRLRLLVSDNVTLVTATLLVLAAVGGFATYTAYADTTTKTETREVSSWESTGEFTHRATVVGGTDAFDEGTVLRNRSVYLRQITPRTNGTFTYGYTATDSGNLTAETSLTVVLRSVKDARDGNGTVYWRVERPLDGTERGGLEPGERVRVPFSVNVSALEQRADSIEQRVGDPPGRPQIHLLASVNLSGTRNGQPVDRTRTYRLPIEFEQGAYRVRNPGPQQASGRQTREVTLETEPGPLQGIGGPVLFFLSAGGLVALAFGHRSGRLAVSETERDWLAFRDDREEFDDWITVGRVPVEATDRPCVEVDSLSGLVDTAIDTDERVIEDPSRDQFVVVSDAVSYVYDPSPVSGDARAKRPSKNGSTAGSGEQPATDGSGQSGR